LDKFPKELEAAPKEEGETDARKKVNKISTSLV